jgi:hypothetical protein
MPLLTIIPNAPLEPRRPRWEALLSLPLTGVVLIAGLLLAFFVVLGGTRAEGEEAVPAVEEPAESTDPVREREPSVEHGPGGALHLAVAPFGEQLYVLLPVQLLSNL